MLFKVIYTIEHTTAIITSLNTPVYSSQHTHLPSPILYLNIMTIIVIYSNESDKYLHFSNESDKYLHLQHHQGSYSFTTVRERLAKLYMVIISLFDNVVIIWTI